jgi:hypothetical protein
MDLPDLFQDIQSFLVLLAALPALVVSGDLLSSAMREGGADFFRKNRSQPYFQAWVLVVWVALAFAMWSALAFVISQVHSLAQLAYSAPQTLPYHGVQALLLLAVMGVVLALGLHRRDGLRLPLQTDTVELVMILLAAGWLMIRIVQVVMGSLERVLIYLGGQIWPGLVGSTPNLWLRLASMLAVALLVALLYWRLRPGRA